MFQMLKDAVKWYCTTSAHIYDDDHKEKEV